VAGFGCVIGIPPATPNIPTNKGIKMRSRYRVEMYDEIKANDITIYLDENLDRQTLSKIVYSYLPKFIGNVKSYVYDEKNKRKTVAAYYPIGSR